MSTYFQSSVSVHPSFDSTNVYNDVALLHVNEPFQFDKHIDRVCLPPPNDRFSYLPRGCKATGWGKDKYGEQDQIDKATYLMIVVNPYYYNCLEIDGIS